MFNNVKKRQLVSNNVDNVKKMQLMSNNVKKRQLVYIVKNKKSEKLNNDLLV